MNEIDAMFPLISKDGDRRNVETGVEIIAERFFDGPVTGYEVRLPVQDRYGYVVILNAESLDEAFDEACAQFYAMRQTIEQDHEAALSAC